MKKLFVISMMAVSGCTLVKGAIPVGTTGSGIIDFASRPAASEWSTASSSGTDTNFGNAGQMDAAVQGISATNLNLPVFDAGATNPPAQNPLASWSGGGSTYLQTRPTGNAGTALMATLRNDTGSSASSLAITYMLNESATTPAEQVPGQLVYVSQTGLPNSWVLIPELSGGTIGSKSNTVVVPGGWASGALLYVLWADDNATGGADRGYQLDDVEFIASNEFVPLSLALVAPAGNPLLLAPADVRVIANPSGSVPPNEVSFYTNDVLFSIHTAAPYSNQLSSLPPGTYSIYAVAVNGTETAYSRTNIVKVRDEFVHYSGGTHTEDFDGMGRVNGETPIGWYVGASPPINTMTVIAGDGSAGAAAGILGWNYGLPTGTDRALGTAPTGADRNLVVRLQNNTSSNIVSFEIRYDGEVWRNYTNTVGGWLTNLVSFDFGASWTPTTFDFAQPFTPAEPQGAVDGNAAANRIANIGGIVTPPAVVPPGGVISIRWHDFNDAVVTDGGLAIDHFTFTATFERFMSFVTITRPTNEAIFPEAAPVIINATASMDNPISHVSFYRDGILIGDDTNAPYSAVYSNSTPGIHTLTATAHDVQGLSVTAVTPVQITVNSNVLPSITITNPPDGSTYFVGVTVSNISASAFDQDGAVVRVEFYLDGNLWATDTTSPYSFDLCDITAGSHTLRAEAVDNASGRVSDTISITATNPPGVGIIITNGSMWKYLDDGSDQGSAWRQLTYDDSNWSSGVAELGYGDGPGRPERTTVGFGPNPNSKHPTTYFRKIFNINNPSFFSNVILRLLRDDHAIVYLNGNQVFSDIAITPVDFSTYTPPASADDGTVYEVTNIPPALLVQGANVLAVEVHQDVGTSSDISFDLMLWGQGGQPEPPLTGVQPPSRSVAVGATTTFAVDPSGTPPFSYQWHFNCGDIPDGTNRILTIQGARFEDAGNYSVTIRNAFGQVTSWDASLSVSNVPAPFMNITRGSSNVLLRWPRRDVPYRLQELAKIEPPGANQGMQRWSDSDASVELNGQEMQADVESPGMNKFFQVISPSIRIITHPQGRSANLDENVTLSVVATGAPPFSYQWRFNGSPLIGETNPAISILVNRSSYGAYQVAVADANDALLSRAAVLRPLGLEATLSDSFQGRSLFIEPTGSLHGLTFGASKESGEPEHAGLPGGRSVWLSWRAPASGMVTFDTIGSGFDTLLAAYPPAGAGQVISDDDSGSNLWSQIQFNVSADTVYNIAIDGLAGAGGFFVLNWSFTQLPQSLSLPIIDLQPADRIIKSNEVTSFTVVAHDLQGPDLQYQWYQNGQAVPPALGGTSPTLFVGGPQALPFEVGQYYVEVMNSVFRVRSRLASLQISSDPEFRFVSKLLVDSICGFTSFNAPKSATQCCGVNVEDSSKTMEMPKLLSAAAGSLTGSLTYGGTTPPVGSRAYWTWVTNGWDCLKLVALSANVTAAGTPQSCTLVIIDGATGLLVKAADSGMSPNISNINKAKAGKVYWIALGFDNPSAIGTLSYSFTGTCP